MYLLTMSEVAEACRHPVSACSSVEIVQTAHLSKTHCLQDLEGTSTEDLSDAAQLGLKNGMRQLSIDKCVIYHLC